MPAVNVKSIKTKSITAILMLRNKIVCVLWRKIKCRLTSVM